MGILTDLDKVPYPNLFEEFIRRLNDAMKRGNMTPEDALADQVAQFAATYRARNRAAQSGLGGHSHG
jgi:hypothetical protein